MNATRTTFAAILSAAVLTAGALASSDASAGARSTVRVINNSSHTVVSIHSSPTYRSEYGSIDLLGSYVLRSGYNVPVDFDTADAENECVQDVIAKAANGVSWKRRLNVCTATTWTLQD